MNIFIKSFKLHITQNWIIILCLFLCIILFECLNMEQWQGAFIGIFLAYVLQDWLYLYRKLKNNYSYSKFLIDMNKNLAKAIIKNFLIKNGEHFDKNFVEPDNYINEIKMQKFIDTDNEDNFPALKEYFNAPQKYFFYNTPNGIYIKQLIENYFNLKNNDFEDEKYLTKLNILASENIKEIKPCVSVESSPLEQDKIVTINILRALGSISKYTYK